MDKFKGYLKNLLGFDLLIIAIYIIICAVIGGGGKVDITIVGALFAGLQPLFTVLFATILISLALYLINEV